MLAVESPKVGDTVTGVVTGVVGAQTSIDPESGDEVTRLRFEVELEEPLEAVDVLPQEPAGGVEPHAGEPEPKVTSSDQPNRKAAFDKEMEESKARAQAKVDEAKSADQNAKNKADADKAPAKTPAKK
jgi:hypothetical protein